MASFATSLLTCASGSTSATDSHLSSCRSITALIDCEYNFELLEHVLSRFLQISSDGFARSVPAYFRHLIQVISPNTISIGQSDDEPIGVRTSHPDVGCTFASYPPSFNSPSADRPVHVSIREYPSAGRDDTRSSQTPHWRIRSNIASTRREKLIKAQKMRLFGKSRRTLPRSLLLLHSRQQQATTVAAQLVVNPLEAQTK